MFNSSHQRINHRPPAAMFSSLGSSYRDAAAASGRNYRDFAAASSPGHSLGDYWRQRKWKPGQLKLERAELPAGEFIQSPQPMILPCHAMLPPLIPEDHSRRRPFLF